ncbi:MAG: hypothetical protein HYY06_01610 [Deltaproteobacteria bacterium]|nr:hypothetical protein [Deltaproteobacteria bacterium]
MRRPATAAGLLLVVVVVPATSLAQSVPPPVVENPPPVVENAPPVVENRPAPPPVVQNRPRVPPPVAAPVVSPAPRPVDSYPEVAVQPDDGARGRGWPGKVFLGGLGLYLLSYGLTALVGAAISDPDGDLLFWPVVGPMLYYDRVDGDSDLLKAALISTIAQSLGIIIAIYGVFEMFADDR